MNIAGIGLVCACGRGIKNIEESLRKGWTPPSRKSVEFEGKESSMPLYLVSKETMVDSNILGKLRRADRITRMAVLAASDAVSDSAFTSSDDKEPFGIIMTTSYGAHTTKFRYQDDIINYGEENISPMVFSHVIHNAAVSYVATVLKDGGPALTIAQFAFSFQEALNIARAWMHEGRCRSVLVGATDECGNVMEAVWKNKWPMAEDGRIKPFEFSEAPRVVPGEGSVFFMLTNDKVPNKYCEISDICFGEVKSGRPDMYVIDADGTFGDETVYKDYGLSGVMTGGYLPIFGSMIIGSAFSCAVAALTLKNQTRYACPVKDNPTGANICLETRSAATDEIHCVRHGLNKRKALIKLKK